VASQLARLPAEEGSCPLLRLSEGETRQPIGIARIVGRSKRIVMLAAIVTAEAGNPRPAFGTFSVADRASHRNDRPVGLAPPGQFGAGGAAVDFGVLDDPGHKNIPYGNYTEMMQANFGEQTRTENKVITGNLMSVMVRRNAENLALCPFHGENRGSIPLGRANDFNKLRYKTRAPVQDLANISA
jgi:hypothetical protein